MKKINKILADTLQISVSEAEQNLNMDQVAGWDSLTHMNLIASLESQLTIELSGDEIAEMISFNSIRDIVSQHASDHED